MDVKQIVTIISIFHIVILGITSIGACLYAIPLSFIRQFHKPIHFLTLNVCIATFICANFWLIYYIMNTYYPFILWTPQSCLLIIYLQNMVNCQLFYAVCMVSFNRLLSIIYKNKRLFSNNRWAAICISAQWIFAALTSLPILFLNPHHCLILGLEFNYRIYEIAIGIVLPAIFSVITNSIIYVYARRSTRRLQGINVDNVQAPTVRSRDARLLKHMVFMITIFVCGWAPIYILLVINLNGTIISPITMEILSTVPVFNLLVNVGDLFLYNHELRRYFTNRRQLNSNIRTRRPTRPGIQPERIVGGSIPSVKT